MGYPSLSRRNPTSTLSNEIEPVLNRSDLSFLARRLSTCNSFVNCERWLSPPKWGEPEGGFSINSCASLYVNRLSEQITVFPNHSFNIFASSFISKTAEKHNFSSSALKEQTLLESRSGSMGKTLS